MNCYVKFEDRDYKVEIGFRRLLDLLAIEKTDAEIEEAIKQAVLEA